MERTDQMICRSFIDANFIRQYCLPDKIINLDDFRFYIRVKCNLSLNDVEKIVNSFQINSFFIAHQWTNVKCVYDENESYQHLFSSNLNKFQHFHRLFNNQFVSYDLSNTRQIEINFDPSLDLFLKQFDELYPQVSSMKIPTGPIYELTDPDKIRIKVFARLISMPVQLKYFLADQFEWLLYITQYKPANTFIRILSGSVNG
ncbi:unnamed protein product [Rotaria sordida]|uniref:Uncharacterized protein n=1 Tax=Rotaria sordida TaxID=392033 RepID=A0A819IK22_9BILA|nr:unnamed protein product [Rotaria sordida]